MAKKTIGRSETELRARLAKDVVDPLFAKEWQAPATAGIPVIVLENRRKRAQLRIVEALVSRGSVVVPAEILRETQSLVGLWESVLFDDGFRGVEKYEIDRAKEREYALAVEAGDAAKLRQVIENEYRRKVVEQYGRIELRGLGTSHRILLEMDRVYVPLHLEGLAATDDTLEELMRIPVEYASVTAAMRVMLAQKLDSVLPDVKPKRGSNQSIGLTTGIWHAAPSGVFITGEPGIGKSRLTWVRAIQSVLRTSRMTVEEALGAAPRALITGEPGSGKSTLAGWLAIQAAVRNELPVLLPARILRSPALTFATIAELVGLEEAHLREAAEAGRALLVVDGLDEAVPLVARSIRASLAKLAKATPLLRVVVTARPAEGLAIAGFTPYSVGRLTNAEVNEFVAKWCVAAEESAPHKGSPAEEALAAAADLQKRIERAPAVQRLATNPLMTTILCVVHRFLGRSIPEHRVTLYDKCTDVLLYEWDRAKFPEGSAVGKLDALAKRNLLTWLAREMHDQGLAEIGEAEAAAIFLGVLPRLGAAEVDPKALLAEIRDRSGLLVEKRPGYFGFSHLLFQEYLTALAYVKDWRKLPPRYAEGWWQEVICLAAGVPGVDAGKLIQRLLGEKTDLGLVMAARCLETATVVPVRVRERVEQRLKRLIPPRDGDAYERLRGLGAVVAPLLMHVLHHSENPGDILNTMICLGQIGYSPAIPSFVSALQSELPDQREFAAIVLEAYFHQDPTAQKALAEFKSRQKESPCESQ